MNNDALAPTSYASLIQLLNKSIDVFTVAEMALTAVFVVLAFAVPRLGNSGFGWVERRFAAVAWHPLRQIIVVGLLAVVLRALMLLRLSTLMTGSTGVRPANAETYAAVLNAQVTPVVHEYG